MEDLLPLVVLILRLTKINTLCTRRDSAIRLTVDSGQRTNFLAKGLLAMARVNPFRAIELYGGAVEIDGEVDAASGVASHPPP